MEDSWPRPLVVGAQTRGLVRGQVGAWETQAARAQSRFESRWRSLPECCFSLPELGLDHRANSSVPVINPRGVAGWLDGLGGGGFCGGVLRWELDCSRPWQSRGWSDYRL